MGALAFVQKYTAETELLSPSPVKETMVIRLKVCFTYYETVAQGLRVTPPFLPSQFGSVPRYGPNVCVP